MPVESGGKPAAPALLEEAFVEGNGAPDGPAPAAAALLAEIAVGAGNGAPPEAAPGPGSPALGKFGDGPRLLTGMGVAGTSELVKVASRVTDVSSEVIAVF